VTPTGGTTATTDTPTFVVQNAKGFDAGQALYAFVVRNRDGSREIVSFTVPAGSGTTSATPPSSLPRGLSLTWAVVAQGAGGEAQSDTASFQSRAVDCLSGRDAYAKAVVDWWLPACSLEHNIYNDPREVLGPPDAGGTAPDHFHGFMSLGEKGYVTVDMQGCMADGPGFDIRVFQSVSKEPVTLYASGDAGGPFQLIESRKQCGEILPGVWSHYCDFDLSRTELKEARYIKIEDGEVFPCERGTTVTEGADIDAIQILNGKP
jgi:hypothetical protein